MKVPAIVSQELFDKVQERIRESNQRYCQPSAHHLLRGIIECGDCGCAFYSYHRYYTKELMVQNRRVHHKAAYECRGRAREHTHCRDRIERCHNSEIATHLLEDKVFEQIHDVMLDPVKLRACIDLTKDSGQSGDPKIARKLAKIARHLVAIDDRKKRIIDEYASHRIPKGAYVAENIALDEELDRLNREKASLDAISHR